MDASTLDISRAVLPEGQYDGEDEDAKSLLEYLSGISDCSSGMLMRALESDAALRRSGNAWPGAQCAGTDFSETLDASAMSESARPPDSGSKSAKGMDEHGTKGASCDLIVLSPSAAAARVQPSTPAGEGVSNAPRGGAAPGTLARDPPSGPARNQPSLRPMPVKELFPTSAGTDDEAASQAEPLPPLSVMADATPAEYRRLLHAVSAMRTELQACRSANAALHADRHAVWASLQASQQREQALQHALAAERQHKGFLLHYVQGEGHGQDGLDLSLEALRGSAAEAAAELAERRSQEALQAQAKAAAACSALARAEAVHEAERQALQSELARLNEGLATGAIVQADSRRSGQAQAAAHERLVHGMRADLATVRRQRAEAEEELERLVGDMSSMRARLEEKDVAIDGLASDLRVSGEALSIVKHALAQRNAELQAARRRVDELQRTVDRTAGGDVASFVTTSSNAVALLKERYGAETRRLRQEVQALQAELQRSKALLHQHEDALAAANSHAQRALPQPVLVEAAVQCDEQHSSQPPPLPARAASPPTCTKAPLRACSTRGIKIPSLPVPSLQVTAPFCTAWAAVRGTATAGTQTNVAAQEEAEVQTGPSGVGVGVQCEVVGGERTQASASVQTEGSSPLRPRAEGGSQTAPVDVAPAGSMAEQQGQMKRTDAAMRRLQVHCQLLQTQVDEAQASAADAAERSAHLQRALAGAQESAQAARSTAASLEQERSKIRAALEEERTARALLTSQLEQCQADLLASQEACKAAQAGSVMLRLAWHGLVRKAGQVAAGASAEVSRLREELSASRDLNASLVSSVGGVEAFVGADALGRVTPVEEVRAEGIERELSAHSWADAEQALASGPAALGATPPRAGTVPHRPSAAPKAELWAHFPATPPAEPTPRPSTRLSPRTMTRIADRHQAIQRHVGHLARLSAKAGLYSPPRP